MATYKSKILFDILSNILLTKSQDLYNQHVKADDYHTASKFILLKYLTMSYSSQVRDVVLQNYMTLEKMPDKVLYKWLLSNVPRQKSGFIRYIR